MSDVDGEALPAGALLFIDGGSRDERVAERGLELMLTRATVEQVRRAAERCPRMKGLVEDVWPTTDAARKERARVVRKTLRGMRETLSSRREDPSDESDSDGGPNME